MKWSMRDYAEMKDIVIPKEQEDMMDIICDAWEECRSSCGECKDRPKEYMRMMECTSLKYTRKLMEAGYRKQSEVAKEIFEEIEQLFIDVKDGCEVYHTMEPEDYCGLKKKYTEEQK